MKTVLNVKTDKEVKEDAQELARELGVPLSTVVNAYLKEFVRAREFRIVAEPRLKEEIANILKQATKDRKDGKKVSKRFASGADALNYLHR